VGRLVIVIPIPFIETGCFKGIYPLKQFALVIHGNHQVRAAPQWAKPPTNFILDIFCVCAEPAVKRS